MQGVLSGFIVIAAIVGVGIFLGSRNVLGAQGRFALNRLTYYVAAPCLVFSSLIDSDLAFVFSDHFAISAITALAVSLLAGAFAVVLLKKPAGESVVIAVSAAMVNSANMGFPIAQYVLGDMKLALPIALWQMAIFTPLFQFVLHSCVSGERPSLRFLARSVAENPMIIASALGIAFLAAGFRPPQFIVEPIDVLAGISIPGMLIAFGMSLTASKPFAKEDGNRPAVALASVFKLAVMPALSFVLARFVFGLESTELYAAVVFGALPTAQNVYVAAAHYGVGEEMTRDTALLTSIGTMLVLLAVAACMGA